MGGLTTFGSQNGERAAAAAAVGRVAAAAPCRRSQPTSQSLGASGTLPPAPRDLPWTCPRSPFRLVVRRCQRAPSSRPRLNEAMVADFPRAAGRCVAPAGAAPARREQIAQ
eukprot:366115-Chlamydomonas_euryale.AAC.9